jgi:CheY-like chemotaxis protein
LDHFYFYYAIALFETRRFQEALSEEQTSYRLSPGPGDQPLLALLYYANHDYRQAESMARSTLDNDQKNETALSVLTGIAYHGASTYVRIQDSQGKMWDVPGTNLGAARRVDPNLQVIPAKQTFSQLVQQVSQLNTDSFWVHFTNANDAAKQNQTERPVEIARLTLVDSVHGEVTSLRAKRDPEDRDILLSMVDEYETELKLAKSKISVLLTAEEVLAVFRDADPTPLATTCQAEFSSFFYPNLMRSAIPDLRRKESKHLRYWGELFPPVPPEVDYFPGKGDMDVIPWASRIHRDPASCERVDWVVRAEGEKIAREHYIGRYHVSTPRLTKEEIEKVYERKRHPSRILVVHHERLIGEFICKLLKQDGYETRIEWSSADAIRAAGQFGPRLLIIDPVMPQISGLDVAKHIYGQTRCKVLLVSAGASESGFEEIPRELRGEGCDCATLGLPFEREELLELVRARIGSETVVPGDVGPGARSSEDVGPKDDSPESIIDFVNMTPVIPDAELPDGFARVIMPDGKCFDILEELCTKARGIEPRCVIMWRRGTSEQIDNPRANTAEDQYTGEITVVRPAHDPLPLASNTNL